MPRGTAAARPSSSELLEVGLLGATTQDTADAPAPPSPRARTLLGTISPPEISFTARFFVGLSGPKGAWAVRLFGVAFLGFVACVLAQPHFDATDDDKDDSFADSFDPGNAADLASLLSLVVGYLTVFAAMSALRSVVDPETGALVLLRGHALDSVAVAAVQRWWVVALIWTLGWFTVELFWRPLKVFPAVVGKVALVPLVVFPFGCVLAAWALSLRLGAAHATAAVEAIEERIKNAPHYTDAEWMERIRLPMARLARETMPALGQWGFSLAAIFVGCGLASLLRVPSVVFKRNLLGKCSGDDNECLKAALHLVANVCLAAALAALPLLVALIPAQVTARCEHLLDRLNDMRPDGDTVLHNRVLELEIYVRNTNRGRGLGFVLFGTVISRRALAQCLAALVGVLTPATTFLISLAPGSGDGSSAT
jgi:hypothetical protein